MVSALHELCKKSPSAHCSMAMCSRVLRSHGMQKRLKNYRNQPQHAKKKPNLVPVGIGYLLIKTKTFEPWKCHVLGLLEVTRKEFSQNTKNKYRCSCDRLSTRKVQWCHSPEPNPPFPWFLCLAHKMRTGCIKTKTSTRIQRVSPS